MSTEEITNSKYIVPKYQKDKKAVEIHLYTEYNEVIVVITTTLRNSHMRL